MKALNDFIAWLYIMCTVIVGLALVMSVNGWYGLREKVDLTLSELLNSATGIWAGLAMVMLGLLFLAMRLRAGRVTKSISFDNPEGEVTVSIKAIEDFVKRVGQEFSQVLELTPSVLPSHDGIKVSAKTTLVTGTNIPKLAENIQSSIKARMQNILGIENVTGVEVHVSKLVSRKGEAEETGQEELKFEQADER